MSDIIKIPNTKNTNEWIDWIEAAIKNEHLKYYEFKFSAILKKFNGSGDFGKVHRANWKNVRNYLALKSFLISIISL